MNIFPHYLKYLKPMFVFRRERARRSDREVRGRGLHGPSLLDRDAVPANIHKGTKKSREGHSRTSCGLETTPNAMPSLV